MENGNSGRRKWDQYSEYGASSSSLTAQPHSWLPEQPRRTWRANTSFSFPDFSQPVETEAGLCSVQRSESLEAMPGHPGRCVLAQTHCLPEVGSFHSQFLPSRGIPKGINSDLQLIGTEESSSNAIQPFTPNSPPDASSTVWISCGRGIKDGGSRPPAGTC